MALLTAKMLEDSIKSAKQLAAKSYKFGANLGKRYPVSALVLFAIAQMGVEEWAESILEIETASGKPIKDMRSLVADMKSDVNYARLVADKVNGGMPSASTLRELIPGGLSAEMDDLIRVLEERFIKRRTRLDNTSVVQYDQTDVDQQLSISTIQAVSATFGLRGTRNVMDLHANLRAFVNTSSDDVRRGLAIIEAAS